ncbi:YraN family protein [Bifidobacterium bifidum]|nr:YraN family protein [Bifidobacterium bifidum]
MVMDTCLTSRAEHAGATTDHDLPVAGLSDMLCRLRDGSLKPKQLGVLGEQYAADWLERHGYTILGRNWHSRYGELDIVMMTPDRVIAFVEVKTRRTDHFGMPQEAVTLHKQTNLRRAGVQWLLEPDHRIRHTGVRFDVLTIVARAGIVSVHHIPGAF